MGQKQGTVSLQGVHIGNFVGDGQEYTEVMGIKGALMAKVTVAETSEPFYSDDIISYVSAGVDSIQIELEMEGLTLAERAHILDQTLQNGVLVESASDVATRGYKGMAFKAQKANGEWRYVSIPKILFSVQEDEFATKAGKGENKSMKIVGTGAMLENGVYKITADSDSTAPANFLSSFLEKIPQAAPTVAPSKSK